MASAGSDLSTRMSAEYNRLLCDIAFKHFRESKVEISDAIKTIFPFFEILRDRGFITNEKYKALKKSWENLSPVQRLVYDVLSELEEKFDLSLLETLFSKVIMKNYPDLNDVLKSFRDVIQKKIFHQANFGEMSAKNPNTQPSIEQGPGANSCPPLSWLFPDPSNDTDTAPPDNRLSVYLPGTEEMTAMDTSTISDSHAQEIQQANKQHAQESKPAVTSGEDSAECRNREEPPEASTSAVKRKPGSTDLTQSPTPRKRLCKRVRSPEGSSGLNAEEKPSVAGNSAVRSGAELEGPVDPGKTPALQKAKRRRRRRQQPGVRVNFHAEILPVACGDMKGILIKRKLEQGATRKCIRSLDGTWFAPREFEVKGGYENSCNWKTSLTCGGKTLKQLIELGNLHPPPKTVDRKKKVGNSDKCRICQDGGKLFNCGTCSNFFHGDCHLPPVETKRNSWICTFCTVAALPSGQQRHRESEVLVKLMGTQEKLKCEFLLLNVYYRLESDIFPKIPHENYVRKASQYLGKLRMLDRIKKKMIKENYSKVEDFVRAMDNFFLDPKQNNLHLTKEEFTKDFKQVFAIQETNQNSSPV